MPIRHAISKVFPQPERLVASSLLSEQLLEDMIVSTPQMLSDERMLIGRQEDIGFGGRIDLLAVAPDGSLVPIESKCDRTPCEVVTQALDDASWPENLRADEIAAITAGLHPDAASPRTPSTISAGTSSRTRSASTSSSR